MAEANHLSAAPSFRPTMLRMPRHRVNARGVAIEIDWSGIGPRYLLTTQRGVSILHCYAPLRWRRENAP